MSYYSIIIENIKMECLLEQIILYFSTYYLYDNLSELSI